MNFYARRRIAVCGSSVDLSMNAAEFCRSVGRRLAEHENTIMLNRGIKQRAEHQTIGPYAADYHFVEGFLNSIAPSDAKVRIETYLHNNRQHGELFTEGRILQAQGRSGEARRFHMVSKADALIAVAGSRGTKQQLALSNALDLPILPVPTFAGAAKDFWDSHREEICSRLGLSPEEADEIECDSDTVSLANRLTDCLMSALEHRCFVIMPFAKDVNMMSLYDEAITPAVKAFGHKPVRLDREGLPGDVGLQIEQGIETCDYAIAVLDHARPNVFYELGMAHAFGKPVIILRNASDETAVPFDISMHQRIDYQLIDHSLENQIKSAIGTFSRQEKLD